MEIAGKRHRAKGVERREKVPTESLPRTPFPSASGYLIGWGFSNLLLFISWRIPQASLNSSFPDRNHQFRLHGNIGTEVSGQPESCTQYRLCQAEDPQCQCQGISVTQKIWKRKPAFFGLSSCISGGLKNLQMASTRSLLDTGRRKWQGAVTALGLWLHKNDIFQEVNTSLHHCWWSPPRQAAQGYWITRGGDTNHRNHRAGWAIWNEIFSHAYLWFLILGKT